MSTYTKNLTAENGLMVGMGFGPVFARKAGADATAKHGARTGKRVNNIALFFAAPFIGLAFVTVGPIVGLGALAWYGGKTLLDA
jgi:hypothetical protein